MKKKLTERQALVLGAVKQSIESLGWPPTRSELSELLGFASPNSVQEHLLAIERKGYIKIAPGISRGIKIIPDAA